MKNKFVKLAAKVTALSMVLSLWAPVVPVKAASTVFSDTMSRVQASALSTHTMSFVSGASIAGLDAAPPALTITMGAPSFTGTNTLSVGDATELQVTVAGTPQTVAAQDGANTYGVACTATANQVRYDLSTDGVLLIQFCTDSTAVTAGVTTIGVNILSASKVTNPAIGTGSYSITLSGITDIGATAKVAIVDYDYVTVTATIQSVMVFDIDVPGGVCAGESAGPYSVSLGNVVPTEVATGANHVCLDLQTNADGGAVVEVKNNTAFGLDGQATPDYMLTTWADAAATTLAPGTEGYGLCVNGTLDVGEGTITAVQPYNGACGTHAVGGVADSFKPIANSGGNPVYGTANQAIDILIKAASATTTMADTYQSVLTFRATGTF
jgi:hypothetical protein